MFDFESITIAKSIKEASLALQEDKNAIIIAGGSDVLIKIRAGKLEGCHLISIRDIDELHGIKIEDDETICIKPLSTFTEITNNQIIKECVPVLAYAVDQVGSPQIRNIGTIGGNISNGVTSADSASTLFALNAELEISRWDEAGKITKRKIPINQYYIGAGKVSLERGELCSAIRIKKCDYDGYCGYYFKYGKRNAMEIATLGCSIVAKIMGDVIEDIRIAFGVASPIPMRCKKAEDELRGNKITDELYDKMALEIAKEVSPRDSWRASKDFRLHLCRVLPVRSLRALIENKNAGKKAGSNAVVGVL